MKTSLLENVEIIEDSAGIVFMKTKDSYKISWREFWVEMTEEDIANYHADEKGAQLGGIYGVLQEALVARVDYKKNNKEAD